MSAFEDFIQQELPLRPFTPTNPDQETVPVRRGPGPRQLDFVDMDEGDVLGKDGGILKGIPLSSITPTIKGYEWIQTTPLLLWNIIHNQGSEKVQVTIWDNSNHQIFADDVYIHSSNTIRISFTEAQIGRAILIFF